MNARNVNWKAIEEWINSHYYTSFSDMPLSISNSLDKANCIKILKEKLFGCASDDIYDIKYLPEHLKSDTEIAILAIELYSNNIFEISQELMASVDFHKLLIHNQNIDYNYIFGHLPLSIRGNKDFINQIISDFPSIYSSLSEELRLDKVILNKVLKKKVFPESLPKDYSNDKKVILKLIEVISYNYKHHYIEAKNDWLSSFISKELLSDREITIKLFSKIKYISINIPDNLKTDKEVILNAIKSNPSYYNSVINLFKTDHEIAVQAFKSDYKLFIKYGKNYAYKYKTILEFVQSIHENSYSDTYFEIEGYSKVFNDIVNTLIEMEFLKKEIVLHLVSVWPSRSFGRFGSNFTNFFKILNPEIQREKNVILKLLESAHFDELFKRLLKKDIEISTEFVYKNYILPFHADDRELILKAIEYAPSLYPNIPDVFKSDEEIILAASRLKSMKK